MQLHRERLPVNERIGPLAKEWMLIDGIPPNITGKVLEAMHITIMKRFQVRTYIL